MWNKKIIAVFDVLLKPNDNGVISTSDGVLNRNVSTKVDTL